jgi:hypothetical protein
MNYRSQILIVAATLTVAFVSAAYMKPSNPFIALPPGPPPLSFQDRWDGVSSLIAPPPLPQIDVPLGLLPIMEMANPAFGTERGRIAWIAEQHADTLSVAYTGKQRLTWPEVWPPSPRWLR